MSLRLTNVTFISGKFFSLATFRWLRTHFSLGLLLFTVSSAFYFIYFIQPTTTIFIDQFTESTTDQLILSSILTASKLPKETINLATLLENEKEIFRQTNSSLIKILQLLEEEKNHHKPFEEQEKILESHQEFFKYAAIVLRNTPYPGVFLLIDARDTQWLDCCL